MSDKPEKEEKKRKRKEKFDDIKSKVGNFFREKAPHLLDVIGDFLPDKGGLGIIKNLIDKDNDIPDAVKEEFSKLYELSLKELELINEDRADARSREIEVLKTKEASWLVKNIVPLIAITWTVFGMTIFIMVLTHKLSIDKGIIMLVINSVSNIVFMIVGYYFGSSEGSKLKTEKLTEKI